MNEVIKIIQDRRSVRVPFDPQRPIPIESVEKILEAARWAPTPHNMQNFELLLVDDPKVLESLANLNSPISKTFLQENLPLLSFSEEDLRQRKVGILGNEFPPDWTDPSKFDELVRKGGASPLSRAIGGSPLLLIVMYDPSRRAPDSEGDMLGLIGLGCLMENLWLAAESLGISVRILSDFGDAPVTEDIKRVLGVPDGLRIAYGLRLGYPISRPSKGLRVRRELGDFVHRNGYGNKPEW
jgi:nitroreductase